MAVTTKKTFTAVGTSPQTSTTVFTPVGIELNNQDDLDVYVTKTTAGIAANNNKRIKHNRQSTSSNVDADHVQVNDTTGLYFPAITHSGGTETLQNYTISDDNNTITFNSALPSGAIVSIERRTRDASSNYTNFTSGSTIRAGDLNSAFDESNFTAQEARNKAFDLENIIFGKAIHSDGWVSSTDLANDSVTTAKIADDAVTTDQIAVNSIVTNRIANGAVNHDKLTSDSVIEAKIANGAVTSGKIGSDAVDGAKIQDNSIDSEHYVDGSIDREHLAADIVDGTKIADDAIGSEHIEVLDSDLQFVDNAKILLGTSDDLQIFHSGSNSFIKEGGPGGLVVQTGVFEVRDPALSKFYIIATEDGSVELRHANSKKFETTAAGATVTGTLTADLADNSIDSEHYVDGSIDEAHIANDAVTQVKIASDAVGADQLLDDAVRTAHILNNQVTTAKIADSNITQGKLASPCVVTEHINNSAVSTDKLNDNAVTLAKMAGLARGKIIVGDASGNPSALTVGSNGQVLKSDGTDISWGTDSGGDANQNAFSNVAVSGQTTVAADTTTDTLTLVGGSNVTITTDASADSVTIAASGGEITVQDEGSSLSTAATTLNFVGAGVVASGTGAAKTITISGSGGAGVTTDFQYLELKAHNNTSGAFSAGSADYELVTKGTSTAVSPTQAAALLISIGGVIQESNTGTSIGSNDGFCIDGSSIHFGANLTAHPEYILYLKGAGEVSALADDSVTGDKIADDAVDSEHYTDGSIDREHLNFTNTGSDGQALTRNGSQFNWSTISTDLSNDTSPQLGGNLDVNAKNIILADSAGASDDRIIFGDNSELSIYYDANAHIVNTLGNLILSDSSGSIYLQSTTVQIDDETGSEVMAKFISDGSVELYHNNIKTFETASTGSTILGPEGGNCELFLYADEGDDNADKWKLKAAQDGTFFYLQNQNSGSWETNIKATGDGGVELYYDNSNKFQTTSSGVTVNGNYATTGWIDIDSDTAKFRVGDGQDLEIYHDGSDSHIYQSGTGDLQIRSDNSLEFNTNGTENAIWCDINGAVKLYYDNAKKFETTSAGVTVTGAILTTGNIDAGANNFLTDDNGIFSAGTAGDLQIYHDGSQSYIVNNTSDLYIQCASDENAIEISQNGSVKLYYDGVKEFQTVANGVELTSNTSASGTEQTIFLSPTSTTNRTRSCSISAVNTDGNNNNALVFKTSAADTPAERLRITQDGLVRVPDGGKFVAGDSDDLQLYHDGTDSHIDNDTSNLRIKSNDVQLRDNAQNFYIDCNNGGSVDLYYDGTKKFETTSAGVTITGDLTVTGSAPGGGLTSDAQNNTVGGTNAGDSFTGTDANGNTLIGKNAGTAITSADYNVAIGADCMEANQTGSSNVAIGWEAMHGGTSGNNVAVGYKALHATGGQNSIGIGHSAGLLNTSDNNVFIGSFAGDANTSGSSNTAVGKDALSAVSTNGTNTAVGASAAQNITGPGNTIIGASAFSTSNTGSNCVMMGYLTGQYKTGASNSNVAIGAYSFRGGDEATQNTCVGTSSGAVISTGDNNVCMGQAAGSYMTTGSNNIFIGHGTGMLGSPTGVFDTDSNVLSLGNNSISDFYCADTSISSSDKRDKTDIAEWTHGLDWINKLKPVTYRWDKRSFYSDDYSVTPDGSKKWARQHLGFLAQDVLEVEQSFGYAGKKDDMLTVNLNCDDTSYGMKYERLVVVLTKAVQELSTKNDALEARIATLEAA